MYPLVDFLADLLLRPIWVSLVMYPLTENLLADVPFGRFFASSHLGALSDLPSGRVVALSMYPFAIFSLAMYPSADSSLRPTWVPLSIYYGRIPLPSASKTEVAQISSYFGVPFSDAV